MLPFPPRIPGDLSLWLGVPGYLLLVFTPGAWITFGFALDEVPFWARLFTGAALSPLVVFIEFYTLRLIAIPFGPTAYLLIVVNLPAIYLIWKRRGNIKALSRSDWLIGAAAVVIAVVCMLSVLLRMDGRIYSAHAWIYSDPVYMFARGLLIPEDPTLAGIKLTYPLWSGLVFQAVHSYLMNSPPMSCYVWNNLLWLIFNYGFAAGITEAMGGGKLAQFSSGILLFMGTNPVGYVLMNLAPRYNKLWGDARYTPWVSKFQLFSTMELGLGMLLAMIYLLLRSGPLTKQLLTLIALLLAGIGLFYPLLFPSACGVLGAKAIALLTENRNGRWTLLYKEWLSLAIILCLATSVTFVQLQFLSSDKPHTNSLIQLSTLSNAARKTFESLIATSLLLAGLTFSFRGCWNSRRAGAVFLFAGALANYLLHSVFHILAYDNEYKFIFVVAMCLTVFPALAVERIWKEWPPTRAVLTLATTASLLLATYAHWSYSNWPTPGINPGHYVEPYDTPIDTSNFYVQLDQRQKWSGVCAAVRRLTPADAVLVLNNREFYYPALMSRSLYVSPADLSYPGVNLDADYLDAEMRGNGREILEQRRATLADFFDANDRVRREQALDTILALKRPVAIIADSQQPSLLEWLKQGKTGAEEYSENGLSLWLILEKSSKTK